jgi:hypothetical protein
MKRAVFTCLSIAAMASAYAQDPSPATPPPQQEPPAEEEKPPVPKPKIEVGWAERPFRGNEQTFRRYGTSPRGFFIKEISYGFYGQSPGLFGEFALRGRPQEDFVGETMAVFGPSATRFEGRLQENEFYFPSPFDSERSSRWNVEGNLQQPLGRKFALVLDYNQSHLHKFYESPTFDRRTRTNRFNAMVAGNVGNGRAELGYSNRQFYDRTNIQPDRRIGLWTASVLQQFGSVDLEGRYTHADIEQPGFQSSSVKAWRLDGGLPIGESFQLLFGLENRKTSVPETLNAFVRERNVSWARLVGRFSGISGEFGMKHSEVERVRRDQSFVDVPKWNTYEGRLHGRFGSQARWTLKANWENLDDDAAMQLQDPRRLFWDDRATIKAQLDFGNEVWSGYLSHAYRYNENESRGVRLRTFQTVLGGTYSARENLDFFGELVLESASTSFREINASLGLESYFPSNRVFTLGGNWVVSDDTWFTLSFTDMTTDNDNPVFDPLGNVSSRYFTAHVQHRTKQGNEFGLTISPGKFSDRVFPQLGYRTTVFMLTANWKY